jgi:hypothetical protein
MRRWFRALVCSFLRLLRRTFYSSWECRYAKLNQEQRETHDFLVLVAVVSRTVLVTQPQLGTILGLTMTSFSQRFVN